MKFCVANLKDAALDWAVAQAWYGPEYDMRIPLFDDGLIFQPSVLWQHGGPIIERERITVDGSAIRNQWMAVIYIPDEEPWEMRGPTPLIAAMRCYVASKFGDTIDIPENLQ